MTFWSSIEVLHDKTRLKCIKTHFNAFNQNSDFWSKFLKFYQCFRERASRMTETSNSNGPFSSCGSHHKQITCTHYDARISDIWNYSARVETLKDLYYSTNAQVYAIVVNLQLSLSPSNKNLLFLELVFLWYFKVDLHLTKAFPNFQS